MKDQNEPPKPIYVYTLSDPRKPDDVRYVGVTNNPKKRLQDHIADKDKNHRVNWIRSLLKDGVRPVMTIIDETDDDNWQQCEMDWIAHYRAIGCDLVNATKGGDGVRGFAHSEETRRKLSEARRGKTPSEETRRKIGEARRGKTPSEETRRKIGEASRGKSVSEETRRKIGEASRGKTHSEETRRKIGEASRGKSVSEETRRKLSEAGRGKTPSEETRRKMSEAGRNPSEETRRKLSEAKSKPVLQYDKFGHFIKQWASATHAQRSGIADKSAITAVCKGKLKSAGGYIWRYANEPLLGEIPTQLKLDFE